MFRNSNNLYHLGLEFHELEDNYANEPEATKYRSDLELLQSFLTGHYNPDFVRICWNDLTASPRMRMIPLRRFVSLLEEGQSTDIGITKACLGMLQHDWLIPGIVATGEYRLHPDFSSIKYGPIKGHISIQGDFREKDGSPVPFCPRSVLQRAVELAAENRLSYLVGFEIEFLLLDRLDREAGPTRYGTLVTDGHAWSVSRHTANPKIAALLRDMVSDLADMGIFVEQVHAESATGQFELILPPLPPVEAVDTLLHTREVMSALATEAGYRMTLHPKPFAHACGTASHVHMSISSSQGAKPEVYESFYAGILKHLRGIIAFTYSNPASYERLADGCWAGGRWVTWGTQNRETALRKIDDSHWELKTMDGLANPYLALGAVLLAGTNGVINKEKLVWGDCEIDPATLTDNDRKELNVTEMLPSSVEEALRALQEDEELTGLLGPELVERYVLLKETELNFLGGLGEDERRQWIMERY
jgi:glutamine synthetase